MRENVKHPPPRLPIRRGGLNAPQISTKNKQEQMLNKQKLSLNEQKLNENAQIRVRKSQQHAYRAKKLEKKCQQKLENFGKD